MLNGRKHWSNALTHMLPGVHVSIIAIRFAESRAGLFWFFCTTCGQHMHHHPVNLHRKQSGNKNSMLSLDDASYSLLRVISCWGCHCGPSIILPCSLLSIPQSHLPSEGLGTKCTENTAPYSRQQPTFKCGPQTDTTFVMHALFHLINCHDPPYTDSK